MAEAGTSASTSTSRELAEIYFGATARRDLEGMLACWAPDGIENIAPIGELRGHDEIRAFFSELFGAFPDFKYETLRLISEGEYAAVHWHGAGTFTGRPWQGLQPNGRRGEVAGIDLIRFVDGKIQRNDVYFDSLSMLRSGGLAPARGSRAERVLTAGQNALTAVQRGLSKLRGSS